MASTRELKGRIRSVQNVAKITNALQLVAASRMRRAQQRAVAARPYAERLRYVLGNLAAQNAGSEDGASHPLLQQREGNRTTLVYFSPNRGLAGSLPGNLNRRAGTFILEEAGDGSQVIAAGRKGRDFFQRTGSPVIAEFNELGDYPELVDVLGISRVAVEEFTEGRTDRVVILYAEFVNTVSQRPRLIQLLPVVPPAPTEETAGRRQIDYIYEPGPGDVLERLLPRYVDMVIYNAALEAIASEQSARFVAMKNATDSASDLIESLKLTLNKARQDSITRELLDIIGGVAALEG
jgi:F-type H+-transporting ATPase subunit gamma